MRPRIVSGVERGEVCVCVHVHSCLVLFFRPCSILTETTRKQTYRHTYTQGSILRVAVGRADVTSRKLPRDWMGLKLTASSCWLQEHSTEPQSDRPASRCRSRWPVYQDARSGRRHSKMMPRAVSNTAAGVRSSSSRPKGLTWQSPGGQRANSLDLMSDHRGTLVARPRPAVEKFGR